MYFKQEFGKEGEDVAAQYLKEKGYKILDRNFACKRGEIDIVAFKDEQIIFVEIKSRTSTKYGLPSEAVTKEKKKKKIKHLLRTAETYLIIKNLMDIDVRIDVIEVYKEKGIYQINHLEQVI